MSSSSKVFGNILNSFNTVSFPINAAGSFSIGTYPVGYRIFPFLFLYFVTSEGTLTPNGSFSMGMIQKVGTSFNHVGGFQ